jgi:cell division protease FtsH
MTLPLTFGPALLLVFLFVLLMGRVGGGIGGIGAFGRSRAQRVEPADQHVTFDDVAGIDEAKAELSEIVDFLRDPQKYRRLGGRIPRGVLLTGPPGTGKTLLARALAGEAEVPFFSISASEFVELFVGVGASRVRDLLTQAKQAAPAIIFIDELDAIGRSRAGVIGGFGGGHDEREQTLNQILTEMDGFDPSVGVIVLSATNRPEVLDPALLRPGRFDRRVAIQPHATVGRRKILEVHTRSVPLAADVDLGRLAATTAGMVGADLANVINEAAPVRKVSIIPRGVALGVTLSAPEADRFSYDRPYLIAKIKVALGGRVAEELVFGEVTTGAQNDIKQITELARNMVGLWGMSDLIGPITVIAEDGPAPLLPGPGASSPDTQHLVDQEVRHLVEDAHETVTRLMSENRGKLDLLAQALLDHETLEQDDAYAAAGIRLPSTEPTAAERERPFTQQAPVGLEPPP